MNLNNQVLANNFLNFGNFSLFNPQLSTRKRFLLNRLIKLVLLFNAIKIIVIFLSTWLAGQPNLRMFLIEAVLFDENYQRVFDVGISLVHVGFFHCFSFWINLNAKSKSLESFRFLFISHPKDLYQSYRQRYQLDRALTDQFLAVYRLFFRFLTPVIFAFSAFLFVVVGRCYYQSFYVVSLAHFLSSGLLLFAITISAYLLMVVFVVPRFVLVLLSTEFLILRAKAIERLLFDRFPKTKISSKWRLHKLSKQTESIAEVLALINNFFRQFKEINFVLDSSFSRILFGAGFILFAIPYFLVFAKNEIEMKLLLSATCFAVFSLCFSISIYNDRLRRQASHFF